jgi:two-component system, LytTR family, sensor kinase
MTENLNPQSKPPGLPTYRQLLPYTLAFELLLATLFVVQMYGQKFMGATLYPGATKEFIFGFVRNGVLGFVLPLVILFTFRYPLEKRVMRANLLRHLAAYAFFTAGFAAFRLGYMILAGNMEKGDTPWMVYRIFLMLAFNANIWIYGPAVAAGQLILVLRRVRERELQAERLRTELVRAELQTLRAQLHPHFLFNTLHSISALIRTNPHAADKMLIRLSDLLRTTLQNSGVQEVPLKTELDVLENYLQIEQVRFQDRLRVHMEIDPELLDVQVPFLALQPIAENCIRHGISKRADAGEIKITVRRSGEKVEIEIADNGPGFNLRPGHHGLGMANTQARLERLYGEAQTFTAMNRAEGGAIVKMVVPFRGVSEPETENPELTRTEV